MKHLKLDQDEEQAYGFLPEHLDDVHKATSIHLQVNSNTYLQNLSENATIYVKENELDPVGATNNLRGLAAKIKFIDEIISEKDIDVKQQYSIGENPDYWEATSKEQWKELDGADKATFDEAYEDRQMERCDKRRTTT